MKIQPIHSLNGEIFSSPSKSYSHRAFALALTAKSPSILINPLSEGDVEVTINFCREFGAVINKMSFEKAQDTETLKKTELSKEDVIFEIIPPENLVLPSKPINAGNSGTSIRLMSALSCLTKGEVSITGEFFKRGRPIDPLLNALSQIKVSTKPWKSDRDGAGVVISSSSIPEPNEISIPGDISSQFITALMFLAPNLQSKTQQQETKIKLTTPAKSFPYLKISEDILSSFGIKFTSEFNDKLQGFYSIPSNQKYNGKVYRIPGDFSSMSFPMVAAALNPFPDEVIFKNIDLYSPQGDKAIVKLLELIGANIKVEDHSKTIIITGGNSLQGFNFDCSQTPDLFPILCVLGLYCEKNTHLFNAEHVRIKETDRISTMVRELRKMGAIIEERDDGVLIEGPQMLKGSTIDHENDHRIAMAMVIAALYCRSNSEIGKPEIVYDSYPRFFDDLRNLGAEFK